MRTPLFRVKSGVQAESALLVEECILSDVIFLIIQFVMLIQLVLNSCRKTAIQLDSIESKIAFHECLALTINVGG